MRDPEDLGRLISEHLSEKVKDVQSVNFQLQIIFRKSWEQPAYFTEEDWNEAKRLVKLLNKLCE